MASRIEPMDSSDLDTVIAIERESFPTPWSLNMFQEEFLNPRSHLIVSKEGTGKSGRISGYICFWHILDELHILNLAVSPVFRRQGVATDLLLYAFDHGARNQVDKVYLEVRVRNDAAQHLYQKLGFQFVAKRPAYYQDTGEDALVFERDLRRTVDEDTPKYRRHIISV